MGCCKEELDKQCVGSCECSEKDAPCDSHEKKESCCGGGCGDCVLDKEMDSSGGGCCENDMGLCAMDFDGEDYSNALDAGKFVVLSVLTMGGYLLYWMYRNWKHIKEYTNKPLRPVARTVAALFPVLDIILFCMQLGALHKLTKKEGRRSFPLVLVCIGNSAIIIIGWVILASSLLIAINGYSLAGDPTFALGGLYFQLFASLAMALILLPVQMTINDFWLRAQPAKPLRTSYTNGERAWLFVGGLFLLLSLISLFMPPPLPPYDYPPAGIDNGISSKG